MLILSNVEKFNTPAYVFSEIQLLESYKSLCSKMPEVCVYYTLKANAEIPILQSLEKVCAGFEVASDGEFERALAAGIPANKIICGLPVKKISTIEHLYKKGCNYFIFDLMSEYKKLQIFAPNARKILRININDILPHSLEFGMSCKEIENLICSKQTGKMIMEGLSFHISDNKNIDAFNLVWERVLNILQIVSFSYDQEFILNIGGGYRNYASNEFFENLTTKVISLKAKYPKISVIAEPGNTIVNDCGLLITKVIALRQRSEFIDVYMDAGKPSGLKTDNKRIPEYIYVAQKAVVTKLKKYRFVDLTCMHRPHFAFELPYEIMVDDVLVFGGMGAYSVCLQSQFHAWKAPNIYMIE